MSEIETDILTFKVKAKLNEEKKEGSVFLEITCGVDLLEDVLNDENSEIRQASDRLFELVNKELKEKLGDR